MKVLRKTFLVLLLFLLLMSITLLDKFFINRQYIDTFKSFANPEFKISESILEDYYSDDYLVSKNAADTIIHITLKNLGYKQWLEYISYMELKVFRDNIIPDNKDELLIVLNLSKDSAVIAVYTHIGGEYVYMRALEDILPVQNISFIEIPNENTKLLQVEQILDERLGAFFMEQFIEIFSYVDEEFKRVWKKTKVLEEIYNQQWIDPQSRDDQWIKILENNTIDILNENTINIKVIINRKKLTAVKDTVPSENDFTLVEELITEEKYYWNPKYQHFIIFEGIDQESIQSVAIINDTTLWRESYFGIESNNYVVKKADGKTVFINQSFITKP